jgi:hypothetical protein
MNEPESIVAGDSASWIESSGLYPAPTWVLTYILRGPVKIPTITATQYGTTTQWQISLNTAATVDWTPGIYKYQAYATSGADRYTLWSGTIEVKEDLSEAADEFPSLSHVRKTLTKIESAIENYMGTPYHSITIAGRTHENVDMTDLVNLRARYKGYLDAEIKAERIAKGLDGGGRILLRFGGSS